MTVSADQLADLIKHHWGPLLAWIGPRDEAAEDIVQRAFIALSTQNPAPANPTAWLYTTSRNLATNERLQRKRRRRRQQAAARPESDGGDPPQWQSDEAAAIAAQLGRLPDAEREVVVAHLWGGLTFREIATALGTSSTTVWRRYTAALHELRRLHETCEQDHEPCATRD